MRVRSKAGMSLDAVFINYSQRPEIRMVGVEVAGMTVRYSTVALHLRKQVHTLALKMCGSS